MTAWTARGRARFASVLTGTIQHPAQYTLWGKLDAQTCQRLVERVSQFDTYSEPIVQTLVRRQSRAFAWCCGQRMAIVDTWDGVSCTCCWRFRGRRTYVACICPSCAHVRRV